MPRRRLSLFAALLLLAALVMTGTLLAIVAMMLLGNLGVLDMTTRDGLLWAAVIQDVLAFVLPALALAMILWQRPFRALRLNVAPSWTAIGIVIVMQAIALPAMNWVVDWNANHLVLPPAMEDIARSMEDAAANQTKLLLTTSTIWQMVTGVVVIGFVAAFSEELLFRGALQGTWMDYAGLLGDDASGRISGLQCVQRHVAVWVVAIIFSAIHMQFYGFVPRMLLGAWLGYLLVWSRSIWVPMIAHALNNSIVVVSSHFCEGENLADTIGLPAEGQFPWLATASAVLTIVGAVVASKIFLRKKQR